MESIPISFPDDMALKIVSFLQVPDLCALGSCSRFWREICESECLWKSLARERWPFLGLMDASSTSSLAINTPFEGWRGFYIRRHNEMAGRANVVVKFVEECSLSSSIEVGDYLKAIADLHKLQLGFKDVQMFLLKPELSVLINLVGLHYCITWLGVPAKHVTEALESYKITNRHVSVKWWKLGRWFYGYRMRDESYSRWVSLADLTMDKEEDLLAVLHRGAIHEVMRVLISTADPTFTSWCCQITQRQG